jgi:hypothetical protein
VRALITAIEKTYNAVRDRSTIVKPGRWQSMDVSKQAAATTREVLNYTMQAPIEGEDLDQLRAAVKPNLPWADDHFLERVGGKPLNPGVEWARWPWGNSANSFRSERIPTGPHNPSTEVDASGFAPGFSHTYAERMWPKRANQELVDAFDDRSPPSDKVFIDEEHRGVRYQYGDLADVVQHLKKAPDSRQAYLPLWFPEDTGKLDVRVPCTLGWHFIHRHGYLHCTYYIRSCDLYRHFRDDVYLAVRLQLWMLEQLRACRSDCDMTADDHDLWKTAKPGVFTMHIVSLHAFVNDYTLLFGSKK